MDRPSIVPLPSPRRRASSAKRRVAVLGGSFDPLTHAHLKIAAEIIHTKAADEVWIVPCGPRQDKSLQTPAVHRYLMAHMAVNAAFGTKFPVYVRDFEIHRDKSPGTYALLEELRGKFPHLDLCFVIGTDLLDGVKDWKSDGVKDAGLWLWENAHFLLVPRPGYAVDDKSAMPRNCTLLKPLPGSTLVSQELSSTEIRTRLAKHSSGVDGLTQPIVLAHIIRYGLYSTNHR